MVDVIDAQTLAAITAPVRIEIATKSRSRILPALAPPYRIAEAPSGLATLSVFVDGYAPVQQEVRPGTSAVRVYVGKGLELRGRITGMTDAIEHPLKVVLSSASLTRCVVPLDAQGEFYIRGLKHELLHVEVPSLIDVHGRIFEPQAFATRRPVSVVPTRAVTSIEVPRISGLHIAVIERIAVPPMIASVVNRILSTISWPEGAQTKGVGLRGTGWKEV